MTKRRHTRKVDAELNGVQRMALNVRQTAFALSVSEKTVRRLKARELLHPVDAITDLRFSVTEIERFLRAHTNVLDGEGE